MGPNGSGKSTLAHVLMGRGDYEVTGGSVTIDGEELLGLPTHERAARGLFLALQYPVELPGVRARRLPRRRAPGPGPRRRTASTRAWRARRRDSGVAQQFLERGAQRGVLGRRAEAGRDAAARGAAAEVRGARRDRQRARRRRAPRRRPPRRGDDHRGRPRRARHHALRAPARRAAPRSSCTCSWAGGWSRPAGPSSPSKLEETGYEGLAAELGVETLTVEAPEPEADPFADPGF